MRRGACGFVHKPWDNDALTVAVRREVELGRASRSSHRRTVREQSEAQAIQRALLPSEVPDVPGCEIAACWKPAATFGGDLYDVTPLAGGRVAISIGDVCGKGLPAALLMANVQAAVRAFTALDPSPRSIIARLNRDLAGNAALRRFVTLFLAVYDPATQRMTYCNAGHNAPLVVRADGSIARLDIGGTVVGAFDHSEYDEGWIDVAGGDHIVLFTDGLVEAGTGGRQFGDEGLLEAIRRRCGRLTAMSLVEAIVAEAGASTAGEFDDDATVVVAGIQ
jgi:sigma-B regulation protein RsbU (phosphoserine phosphatase)